MRELGSLPSRQLNIAVVHGALSAFASDTEAGGAAPLSLAITVDPQEQTEWCWAAVSSSVSKFFSATSLWTQCSIASSELGVASCCADGSSLDCNVQWYLDRALTRTGNLRSKSSGSIPLSAIQIDIQGGLPLGIRVQWSLGGGHFLLIKGLFRGNNGEDYVILSDPIYGESSCALTDVVGGNYTPDGGTWTHTYRTRA